MFFADVLIIFAFAIPSHMCLFNLNNIQQFILRKPYGIHSPFLFSYSKECIFNPDHYQHFDLLENLREELRQDYRQIEVTDYGMGPRFMFRGKNQAGTPLVYKRKVKDIARKSLQYPKYCRLFFHTARYFRPGVILELGTSLGLTAAYLALGNPNGRLISLEGCVQTAEIAKSTLERAGVENAEIITGNFRQTLPGVLETNKDIGLVYIDGDHSFEGVLRNFALICNNLTPESVLIMDDIRWSSQMKAAWKQLVNWHKTTLAIDLGKTGILFFNPALSKQLIRIGF
jgi:predicted O-methyltransferase YrrM